MANIPITEENLTQTLVRKLFMNFIEAHINDCEVDFERKEFYDALLYSNLTADFCIQLIKKIKYVKFDDETATLNDEAANND